MNANFNSPGVHIFPRMKTGNLEVRTDAMVREVLVGSDGLATGVSYVDKKTRKEVEVRGKIVVLAASCCETARIMLNSKSSHFPNGIANSTGLVGSYIMDTVGSAVSGYLPILQDLPPQNEDGVGGMHLTCRGGCTKSKRPTRCRLRAAITSKSAAGAGSPARALWAAMRPDSWRRLRRRTEAESAKALRLRSPLLRPRRDDSERGQLLRDRSRTWSISGAFRFCASTSNGARTKSCRPSTCRRRSRRSSKPWAALSLDSYGAEEELGHRAGRRDHPRSRRDQDGRQPENFGAEPILPGVGRARICSSRMLRRSSATPTRIRP